MSRFSCVWMLTRPMPPPCASASTYSGSEGSAHIPPPSRFRGHTPVDVIRAAGVEAHVIERRDRQIVGLPPLVPAVVRDPQPAVVAGEHVLGVARVDPHVVQVTVHAGEAADYREALAAVLRHDQVTVGLEETFWVLRIDDQ